MDVSNKGAVGVGDGSEISDLVALHRRLLESATLLLRAQEGRASD